jgi:hypothetical protein
VVEEHTVSIIPKIGWAGGLEDGDPVDKLGRSQELLIPAERTEDEPSGLGGRMLNAMEQRISRVLTILCRFRLGTPPTLSWILQKKLDPLGTSWLGEGSSMVGDSRRSFFWRFSSTLGWALTRFSEISPGKSESIVFSAGCNEPVSLLSKSRELNVGTGLSCATSIRSVPTSLNFSSE